MTHRRRATPGTTAAAPRPATRKDRRAQIRGGCFCGKVRYDAAAPPSNSMVCHCRTCRAIAGAPVVAWVTFEKSQFRWVKGRAKSFRSSALVRRTFCAACGTPLTYESRNYPATIDVTTCSLDNSDSFRPTHHSWLRHDLKWVKFGDRLPTFSGSRT